MVKYNVFLSGGGMKGAYQYGFFKRLYSNKSNVNKCFNFEINKLYCSSVGAANSLPILINKMDVLEYYWQGNNMIELFKLWDSPFDIGKSKTCFKGLNDKVFRQFFKTLNYTEMYEIFSKINIITYDRANSQPKILSEFSNVNDMIDAIAMSAAFPSLYPSPNSNLVDGSFADTKELYDFFKTNTDPNTNWLILDLQGSFIDYLNHENMYIFSPTLSKNAFNNIVNCCRFDDASIQKLIIDGENHGNIFSNICTDLKLS